MSKMSITFDSSEETVVNIAKKPAFHQVHTMTMAGRVRFFGFVVVVILLISNSANARRLPDPAPANQISNNKCESQILKYGEGRSYLYKFETQAVTKLEAVSSEENRFSLQGTLAVIPGPQCGYTLIVQEASLRAGEASSTQIKSLENTFLKFGYQDRIIEEGIELAPTDTPWSGNIKRALVSLFNNAALGAGARNTTEISIRENDVSGSQCESKYTITNGGTKYKKVRNLNKCGNRDGGWSIGQGVPYNNGEQEFVSDTLIHSKQTCEQDFSGGILQSASCQETHKLQLLASDTSGAVTTVETSLTFLSEGPAAAIPAGKNATIPAKIYFDHTYDHLRSDATSTAALEQVLDKLCTELSTTDGTTFTAATGEQFLDLQSAAGSASRSVLKSIHDKLKSETDASSGCGGSDGHLKRLQLFLDAAATTASTESIVFMLPLIKDKVEIPPRTRRTFYLNMAFAENPGEDTLRKLNEVVTVYSKDMDLLLASSGLAHQFCKSQGAERCGKNEHYQKLVNTYSRIANPFPSSYSDSFRITALQALGNLDVFTYEAQSAIYSSANESITTSNRIKIQALQAFRRSPCIGRLKNVAKKTLGNVRFSSDLRIHAYLALTRCLTSDDARFIRQIVQVEEVEQVKSFISTHRANMLYSSKPALSQNEKEAYKAIGDDWITEPHFDPRKYSTFFETAGYDEDDDFGYSAGTNLIYGQNSFVPQTLSSNFSVYYVGRAYNLLEVGTNLADFDSYFESLFRPTKRSWESAAEFRPPSPASRSPSKELPKFDLESLNRFRDKVSMMPQNVDTPVSDVYVRLFGTTILSESITLEDIIHSPSPVALFREKFSSIFRSGGFSFDGQIPLLSDELKIPTISGFPLHLQIKSTASASISWLNDLSSDWQKITTNFAPSATIHARGKMSLGTVSGPLNENGVQFDMKLHQSGAVEVKSEFSKDPGSGSISYDGKVKLPADRVTFMEAENEVHWVTKIDGGSTSRMAVSTNFPDMINRKECSSKIGQYFGLQMCASANIRAPAPNNDSEAPLDLQLQPFVLGPNQVSLVLEKTDPKLEEFVVQVRGTQKSFTVLLDTPGSAVDRKLTVNFKSGAGTDGQPKHLDLQIDSPWKDIHITDEITRSAGSQAHALVVDYDGKTYGLTLDTTGTVEKKSSTQLTASRKVLATYKPPLGGSNFEVVNFEGTKDFKLGGDGRNTIQTTVQLQVNVPLIPFEGKLSGSVIRTSLDEPDSARIVRGVQEDYGLFYSRTSNPPIAYQFQNLAIASSWGHFSVDGDVRRTPDKAVNLAFKYGRGAADENTLDVSANVSGDIGHEFQSQIQIKSTQFELLNLGAKWSNVIESGKKYSLGFDFESHSESEAAKLVDIHLKADLTTDQLTTKTNAGLEFKFGSILDSNTKLEIDKDDASYDLKSKHVIIGKTIVLDSSYDDWKWHGFLHLQPEDFYVDLAGQFDRKPEKMINVDSIVVRLNTSALADSKLLLLSYELRGRETLRSLEKVYVDMKHGQDELGRFLFLKQPVGIQLEAFAYKLLDTSFKAGLNPSVQNEFTVNFHGEWFPTGKIANTELVTRWTNSRNPPESLDIKLRLDNGTPTYFYELSSLTMSNKTWANSKNEIVIHGAKSTFGVTHNRVNPELRGKPSLELSFVSATGKDYHALISTETNTEFGAENLHLLQDIDLVVDLPNREPIHVHYLVEVQKQRLEGATQRFVLKTDYEAEYHDPKYQDARYGLNVDIKFDMKALNPVTVLQVHTINADHNLNISVRQSPTELLSLEYDSIQPKSGAKLKEFDLHIKHEATAKFPQEMNRLTLQSKFQDHAEKTSGSADVKYKYKYIQRGGPAGGFPVETLEVQQDGVVSFTRAGDNVFNFKSTRVIRFGKEELYIKYEDLVTDMNLTDAAHSLLGANFELQLQKSGRGPERYSSSVQISNGKLLDNPGPNLVDPVIMYATLEILPLTQAKPQPGLNLVISQAYSGAWYKKSSLALQHDHGGKSGFMFETTLQADGDGRSVRISNVVNLQELSNDLNVKFGNQEKRLFLGYRGGEMVAFTKDANPSFEMNLQWGPATEQNMTAFATLSKSDQSLHFEFVSPALPGNRWTVEVAGPMGSRVLSFAAENPETQQIAKFELKLFPDKATGTKRLTATYEINLNGYFGGLRAGKLSSELTQAGPTRQGFRLQLEGSKNGVPNVNVTLKVKSFDGEHTINALNCGLGGSPCDSFEILLAGQGKYKFQVIGERSGLKTGVSIDQVQELTEVWYPSNGGKQQHIGIKPIILREVVSEVHYAKTEISSAPDKATKAGLEITLSERTIVLAFVQATWENKQADADAYEISIWLNQKRKPEERIGVGLTSIAAHVVGEKDQGRTVVLQFGHPEILKRYQKNLKISTKYRYGITSKIFNVETVVDIFKKEEDKFTVQVQLNHKVDEDGGTVFAIDLVATSKGQQLGFEAHCTDIKQHHVEKTADCKFVGRSREKGERNFKLSYNFGPETKTIEFLRVGDAVQQPQPYFYYNRTRGDAVTVRDPYTGDKREFPLAKTELQLPGMPDRRVHEQTYNMNPFGYSIRSYPSSAPTGLYNELWFGKLKANEYGIGFAHIEGGQRENIFQVTEPKKGRLVFTLRFDWDQDTIKEVLTSWQKRVTATAGAMSKFVAGNENEIDASAGRVLVESLPESGSVGDWQLKELTAILEEQDVPEEVAEFIRSNVELASEFFKNGADNELVENQGPRNLKQGLAARIVAYGELINGVIEGMKLAHEKNVDSSHIYNKETGHKYLEKFTDRFNSLSQIRESIIELESRHAILKYVVTSTKRILRKKFQTFYKVNVNDVQAMFPYPETDKLLRSFHMYMEKRLFGNQNEIEIRDDFTSKLHLALQRIVQETLQLDMKNGFFQFSIPEITGTKLVRRLMRSGVTEKAPPTMPLKFWMNLLLNRGEAVPPIDGKGLILGSSYFQTFDRTIRRFESTCQYLLASDFVDNNFTVAIDLKLENNRASAPIRSIIFTNGQDTIMLTKDNNIFFNGAQVPKEQSTNLGHFRAQIDSDWAVVEGDMRVSVGCSFKMDLCVVRVSGYYLGKLRGVLGNLNYEDNDDFILPSGVTTESTEAFLRGWKLNSDCRTQSISKYLHDIPNYVQLAKTFPTLE